MTTINKCPNFKQNYLQNFECSSTPVFHGEVDTSSKQDLHLAQNSQMTKSLTTNSPDTVEISNKIKTANKEKRMSTAAKIGLISLGVVGSVVAGAVCFVKHQAGKLTKLYNEKMQLVNLAEHIDFKEAKTVEEGIKFAKEVLKIGEVDSNFTLEAINYANRGLIDVSNANKGHLFMPKKISYSDLKDDVLATVDRNIYSNSFGELTVNKAFFDNKKISENIDGLLFFKENRKPIFTFYDDGKIGTLHSHGVPVLPSKEVKELIQKYYKNPQEMNIEEKRLLSWSLRNGFDGLYAKFERYPLDTIKKNKSHFEKELNISINIEDLAKKTTKEQEELLEKWASEFLTKTKKPVFKIECGLCSPIETVYHEMGHLQDYVKNLRNLDLQNWKFSSIMNALRDVKENKKSFSSDPVSNRWETSTNDHIQELLEKNPTKFKKRYPDLYEHLTNQEIQQTAGKVSWYAQTGIGEFIAEVYAKMIRGDKIPDDVMKLYEKYNGPKLCA